MESIRIVEYSDKYAASLAKMWNMSADNWGGSDSIVTEKDIIEENENSGNINIYLALDGEEVVGYCSFSEYREDEGSLYIPLLNVRPDYHGKRVGKKLVLQIVNRTIELGWPRLDLYTWPGNTKAVPMYKKCGFFWEKRDDSTHLMNFIPTVLQTEALKEYFKELDWYDDSKRPIEIKPDGDEDRDYSNYEYVWERNDKFLRVGFERKARGLRLIETNDYIVEARIKEQDLVFGRSYKIYYNLINKTGKNLSIAIKGMNDKNITFKLDESIEVTDSSIVEGEFYVSEIEEEQSLWRTHPAVAAEIIINGNKALFKIGLTPKFPLKLSLVIPDGPKFKGLEGTCYLDIENNFDEEARFVFELPSTGAVEFIGNKVDIWLKPKARTSIPIRYILKELCIYGVKIPVSIIIDNDTLSFTRRLTGIFNGYNGKLIGETDDNWVVCNGKYTMSLSKFDNEILVSSHTKSDFESSVMYPKIGLPYSMELSKKRPENVDYLEEGNSIGFRASYSSKAFKDIRFVLISKLYPNGITEHYYELHNKSLKETQNDIWISQNVYHSFADAVIPYEDKIIKNKGTDGESLDYWDMSKISKSWIFSQNEKLTRGLCWPSEYKAKFNNWFIIIEANLGKIKGNGYVTTKPCYIAWDTFKTWQEFRSFALESNEAEIASTDKLMFEIGGGNPFVKQDLSVRFKDYRKAFFNGIVEISSENDSISSIRKKFRAEEAIRTFETRENISTEFDIDVLSLHVDFDSMEFTRKSAIFNIKDNEIEVNKTIDQVLESITVNNGAIEIKASPQFSNTIYSLKYKGEEWLDTSYPTPKPKSWWNPWSGGIGSRPRQMTHVSIAEEARTVEDIQISDNLGNLWTGIKIGLKVEKNKKFRGLELNQYTLLLPGVPVVLNTVEIVQNSGTYLSSEEIMTEMFLKTNEEIANSWFICKHSNNEEIKYKAGRMYDIRTDYPVFYGGKNRQQKLLVFNGGEETLWAFANNQAFGSFALNKVSSETGKKTFTPPTFMIFTDKYIDKEVLEALKNIRF